MSGRTTWWPKDAAWHRRELIVELGEEFGAEGPLVLDVLSAWAQEQRNAGYVRGGWRTLAREAFVTVSHALSIVTRAAEIGALDDLETDPDGRRFTARVSGWQADQEKGRAAVRQAAKRDRDAVSDPPEGSDADDGHTVTDRDKSRRVTEKPPPDLTRELQRKRSARERDDIYLTYDALHPALGEVLSILDVLPGMHSEPSAVDAVLRSHADLDHVGAAHTVASMVHGGEAKTHLTHTILRGVLRNQNRDRVVDAKTPAAPARFPGKPHSAADAEYQATRRRRSQALASIIPQTPTGEAA